MIKKKIKIGFSMIMYSLQADQNYEHDVDFIRKLSQNADVYLIIERGQTAPNLKNTKIFVQNSKSLFLLVLEHLWITIKLRLIGVRVFYSRNSLMNAVIAGLICKFTRGDTYLWSCGEIRKGRETTKKEKGYFRYLLEISAYFIAFKLIKGLITGTDTMKEYYVKEAHVHSSKVYVLPNWVDLSRFNVNKNTRLDFRKELSLPSNAFVLLFPRSLSKRHGTLLLPEILRLLRLRGVNAYLIASGRGNLDTWLEENALKNGVGKYLRILGGVPNLKMPYLFSSSNVCIVPSETEGFPRVILESMAMGVPFVAHAVGGISDIISKKQIELTVPNGELQKFVDILERLSSNSSWKEEIIEEGRRQVARYDVVPVVDDFIHLFKNTYIKLKVVH